MKLEEAKIILERSKNNYIEELNEKEIQAIKTVLEELETLEDKIKIVNQYLADRGMISDYLRYKSIISRRCK